MVRSKSIVRAATAAVLLTAAATFAFSADKKKAERVVPKATDPSSIHSTGEIVDCGNYLLMGKKPSDNRDIQVKNINSGMPACFIDDADGEVYLLVDLAGNAKERFQPTDTWLSAGVDLDGVVYQKGNLKAITINEIRRTGAFTDRESRRKNNPQPNRKDEVREGEVQDPEIKP